MMMVVTSTRAGTTTRAVATSPRTSPCRCGYQYIVVIVVAVVAALLATARRALKGRVMLVHDDALAAVAEAAVVFGLEARDALLEFGDGVVSAAAYAGTAEHDHAAHG